MIKQNLNDSLANSLRQLMMSEQFDKITIKKICDKTGVIRATFYNHFLDKYDCLEKIIFDDIFEDITGSLDVIIQRILKKIDDEREFYRICYNSVDSMTIMQIVTKVLNTLFMTFLNKELKDSYKNLGFTKESIARFYACGLEDFLRNYVLYQKDIPYDVKYKEYKLLSSRPISEFVKE